MKNRFLFSTTLLSLLLMKAAVGFSAEDDTLQEAMAIAKPGVVIVASRIKLDLPIEDGSRVTVKVDSMGTGFVIHSDGTNAYIATCAHLVPLSDKLSPEQLQAVVGINKGKTVYKVMKIVAWNQEEDIAILRVACPHIPTLRLKESSQDIDSGAPVVALGFPTASEIGGYSFEITPAPGMFTGRRESEVAVPLLQIDADVHPGHSGGPLINAAGEVIGIVNAKATKADNIAYAIPVELLRTIMREKNVPLKRGEIDDLFDKGREAFKEAERKWFFKSKKYDEAKEHFEAVEEKCDYHQGAAYYLDHIPDPPPWPFRPEFIVLFSVSVFSIASVIAVALILSKKDTTFCPNCGNHIEPSWGECPYCAQQRLYAQAAPNPMPRMPHGQVPMPGSPQPERQQHAALGGERVGLPQKLSNRISQALRLSQSQKAPAPSTPARATLLVRSGETTGLAHPIAKPEVSIGRNRDSDIVLGDAMVSGRHATIIERDGRFMIVDAPSRNGTYLNGVKISNEKLQDGDELRLGDTILTFRELK
jgi:hypothetical protein